MRLIDADRLNDDIKSKFGYSFATAFVRSMQDLSQVQVFKHIMRLIEAAPTIEERQAGEWISVSERKPDYTGLYLISLDGLVTSMNFDGVMFTNRSGIRIEVDAWQPLPEPYKKGAEE